ncbi:MAG: hypothetical protein ACJ8KX_14330 [Chthoniobacterales bacterium]
MKFAAAALAGFLFAVTGNAEPRSAAPVIAQIAQQFDQHPLIFVGELHRWSELHAFLREMIRTPEFICRADDIVIEFGNSRLQELADSYISGASITDEQLQSLWRETTVPLTWNSPLYRQFYEAVREINQEHICSHPVRLVLADPPLDWSKIKTASELASWGDRDASFAQVVEREVLAKHHRALLLAGQYHVVKSVPRDETDGPRAAQIIERAHPGALFSVVAVPPSAIDAMRMEAAPSFRVVRGSELEHADYALIATAQPPQDWPPLGEVVDGLLNIGAQHFIYPSPVIYLDPAYQRELRRRATIIKAWSGQDFIAGIDALVNEATKAK